MGKLIQVLNNYQTICFVGNSKNAGKTTVINHVLKHMDTTLVAVTSIGLDGEKIDQVTFMDKPRVYMKPGDLIATAEKTLEAFEASYIIMEQTDIRTSIGNIFIVKITDAGNALIAGPSAISGMARTIEILKKYKPKKILIDGAFFRHSLSKISDATVYVVGANYNHDLFKTVEDARLTVKKFELKKPIFDTAFLGECERVCLGDETGRIKIYDFESAIGNTEKIFAGGNEKFSFLYLPKSLSNDLVEKMIENRQKNRLDIIVDSPVSIQLNFTNSQNLFKLENRVYVIHPINLVAVCFNPYSPKGYEYNEEIFHKELERALGRKVYNVTKEE